MKNNYPKKGNEACLLKRSLAFILSCAIAVPLLVPENTQKRVEKTVHAATENVTYGDVNSDGKISILDMIALKSYITEKNTKGFSVKAADLDGDGTVSAKDAVELSMFLLNQTGSFSCEMNIDTDGDGLCDYVEKEILGTDYLKKDTDGDGLDDYSEVYLCDTDPLNKDTGKTGVKDSAKDADGDKLTNAEEITLGTSPALADTDEDGLSDYDEVKKYKTNPLKEDTDGDGISDNGEIKLGLDPLKVKSDGKTSDAERTFEQKISSENDMLKIVNDEENPYQLSISAKSAGYINEAVSVDISAYSNYLQNDAVTGDIIDIDYADDFKIESMRINFSVSENAERYYIFRYFEDVNMLIPIETLYDGNDIYTECSEDGTYCIVDMDLWISNSSEYEEIQSANMLYNAVYAASATENKSLDCIEVYFLIYIRNNLDWTRTELFKATRSLIDYYNKENISIKLHYISFSGSFVINTANGANYITNDSTDDDIKNVISRSGRITDNASVQRNTCQVMEEYILPVMKESKSLSKQFYIIDNGAVPPYEYGLLGDCSVDISSNLHNAGVAFISSFCNKGNNNFGYYSSISDKIPCYIDDTFSESLFTEIINHYNSEIVTYNVNTGFCNSIPYDYLQITAEWKEIYEKFYSGKLSAEEIKKLGLPDTDGDGTPDCLEIFMKYIKFDANGNIILPTYDELAKDVMKNSSFGLKGLDELVDIMKKKGIDISNLRILPLISNPAVEDSDFDGIPDQIDKNPTLEDIINIDDTIINDDKVFDTDYKTISNKSVDGNGLAFSHSGNLKNNVIEYTRVIRDDGKSTTKFNIEPEQNSDYLITVDAANDANCKISVTYMTGFLMFKKEHEITADTCETKGDNKACYSLEKGVKYRITITVKSKTLSSNTYKVSVEQNNWVYAKYGASRHFFNTRTCSYMDDWYLTDEFTYDLMQYTLTPGNGINYSLRDIIVLSENDYRDFMNGGRHTERLYSVFMSNNDKIINSNNVIGELATEGGVITAAFMKNSLGEYIGTFCTYVGGVTLFVSKIGELREKSLEDAIYYGKLNICFRSQSIAGASIVPISSFTAWNESKYVNKYFEYSENMGNGPYIVRIKCELNVFNKILRYRSEDGEKWEKF